MSSRRRAGRVPCLTAAATLVGPLGARDALSADAPQCAFNKPLSPHDAAVVDRAKAGAATKLQNAECLKILTDFKDAQGRTLGENLDTWRLSASDYVLQLPFRDGFRMPPCRQKSIQMVTAVGQSPVYVCPGGIGTLNSRLARVQAQNPALAEAMVIHEMLHSLGLGENPPTTFEITEQVRRRCP